MQDVFFAVREELERVHARMSGKYRLKEGNIKDLVRMEEYVADELYPALVLLSARIQGKINMDVEYFAEIFYLIYLSSMIHCDVSEDRPVKGQTRTGQPGPGDGFQYPVLVGDYLFSKAFELLVLSGNDRYMAELSEILCSISRGGIIRNRTAGGEIRPEVSREIARLERAELLASCCSMGAKISGADSRCQEILFETGHSLGMALGMRDMGRPEQAGQYFDRALDLLNGIDDGEDRENLRNVVLFLSGKKINAKKMVC
ncbi:MAG: polyprenyl synthetase family protein [Bacillota bacterium]